MLAPRVDWPPETQGGFAGAAAARAHAFLGQRLRRLERAPFPRVVPASHGKWNS